MTTPLTADCLTGLDGICHGFFTRAGGVSTGIYASLNCGLGSRDDKTNVIENRCRVATALGTGGADRLVTLYQVHSATAIVVDRPIAQTALPKADALVTRTPGLVVAALAADCTPVLFADPVAKVVAAAHSGWRGAVGGVLEATIAAMESQGAQRNRIRAAVGPSIGQDHYQVGLEFEAQFLAADGSSARFFRRPAADARPHFDLPGYVASRLVNAGLETVEQRSPCTFANESDFFSYRRGSKRGEPDYGRHISAIVVT